MIIANMNKLSLNKNPRILKPVVYVIFSSSFTVITVERRGVIVSDKKNKEIKNMIKRVKRFTNQKITVSKNLFLNILKLFLIPLSKDKRPRTIAGSEKKSIQSNISLTKFLNAPKTEATKQSTIVTNVSVISCRYDFFTLISERSKLLLLFTLSINAAINQRFIRRPIMKIKISSPMSRSINDVSVRGGLKAKLTRGKRRA